MAVSVVNTAGGNYTNSASSHTVDWSSDFTPTAGNTLLLTLHVGVTASAPTTAPSGWTLLRRKESSSAFSCVTFYKENVASSDTSASVPGWSVGGLNGRWSCIEFSGVPTSGAWGPSEKTDEDSSAATTISVGPTSSLSQATGLSVGIFVVDNGNSLDGSWSTGTWTTRTTQNRTTNGGHTVATRPLASTDGISATYSGFTAQECWAAIAALYDDAAPSGAPTLSDLKAASITATTVQGTYDYAF